MVAINVDQVTRIYQKYSAQHRFKTFKSAIVKGDFFKSLRPDELVAALDNVSFKVEKGTTFGVIGENGSGKSTLLKVITGIAKPTSGSVRVDGKISALIELGAGFHPEISGRENVFINGIMLGLSKKEITEKFENIVRFAELEEFIDAPVKTYSSGMHMRLGFSIAINVNPDILLIDEVLAVGDASFVPKCLDRIDDFRRRKKTILFVSHDLSTVEKICDRVIWLKHGKIQTMGEPKRVVDAYIQDVAEKQEEDFERRQQEVEAEEKFEEERRENRWGKREIEIKKVRLKGLDGTEKHVYSPDEGMVIEMDVLAYSQIKDFAFGIGIYNPKGICCYGTNTQLEEFKAQSVEGEGQVVCQIEKLGLINGTYYLDVAIHKKDGYPYDYHRNLYSFLISSTKKDVGILRPKHSWKFSSGIKIQAPSTEEK
ncbi:MAG: ATP-binding cassette domain-containing protein [Candidatus Aminicenantes bacterium]|nr:ATP-binding cassette domain-containing protein [Candidatus Aminicenantes bacterium]